jgi:hypothetical protein
VWHAAAESARQHNVMLAVEYLNRFECYFLTTTAATRLWRELFAGEDPLCRQALRFVRRMWKAAR